VLSSQPSCSGHASSYARSFRVSPNSQTATPRSTQAGSRFELPGDVPSSLGQFILKDVVLLGWRSGC